MRDAALGILAGAAGVAFFPCAGMALRVRASRSARLVWGTVATILMLTGFVLLTYAWAPALVSFAAFLALYLLYRRSQRRERKRDDGPLFADVLDADSASRLYELQQEVLEDAQRGATRGGSGG